jgi:hypothetical protein
MLCAAGRAQQIIDEETSREGGALNLWLNGRKMERYDIRKGLSLVRIPPDWPRPSYAVRVVHGVEVTLPPDFERRRARKHDGGISVVTFLPIRGAWEKPLYEYKFELDAEQVRTLVASLTKPEPKPKRKRIWKSTGRQVGHPGHSLQQKILDEADRRRAAGHQKTKLAADLAADFKKQGGPVEQTIRRWFRERKQKQKRT